MPVAEHGDRASVNVRGHAIVRKGDELQMIPNEDEIFECLIRVEGRTSPVCFSCPRSARNLC